MAKGSKVHNRIGGILKIGNTVLFIRYLNNDGLPKSGFHLPSIAFEENNQKKHLADAFYVNFASEVKVLKGLFPVKKGKDTLIPYYCEEETPVKFPHEGFEAIYLSMDECKTRPIEPLDYLVARKALAFLPYLKGKKRQVPFTPEEHDKIATMFDSLDYFKKSIGKEETKQFLSLVNSNASYQNILEAYRIILEEYGCNYYDYSDYLAHNGKRKVRP